MKHKFILTSFIVLSLSLALTGCEGGAKEKEELAVVKASLEQTQQELANVIQARDRLQGQVTELTKSRDEAITGAKSAQGRIDELTRKYEEQAKIIRELQEHVQKMQAAIEKL
jgi:peptidoglycan hydrolase CwlO-like protein